MSFRRIEQITRHGGFQSYLPGIEQRITERGLDRTVMITGPISSIEDIGGYNSYEVPGCSSLELTLSTRKSNPADLNEYLEEGSPQIELELGETFGNHRKLIGPIKFGGVHNQ